MAKNRQTPTIIMNGVWRFHYIGQNDIFAPVLFSAHKE